MNLRSSALCACRRERDVCHQRVLLPGMQRSEHVRPRRRQGGLLNLLPNVFCVSCLILKVVDSL